MKTIILGSHLCPDTRAALALYTEKGVDYEFHNLSEDLSYLKEYLQLRETNPLYTPVRAAGGIGIPCVILPNGTATLNPEEALAVLGK